MRRVGFLFVATWIGLGGWVSASAQAVDAAADTTRGLEGISGHPRPQTIEALERAAAGRGDWLHTELIGGRGGSSGVVRVGDEIAFEFESDRDAYLTVVHVDGEGNVTLLLPGGADGRLRTGTPLRFPSGDPLGVVLPIGPESVFAFATAASLGFEALGVAAAEADHSPIDPTLGPAFADCLRSHLDRMEGATVAASRLDYHVKESDATLPYTEESVTTYFATVTRSYQRPTLDLLIHFESGSAELGEEARARLDEVGKALAGPQIDAYTFALNGHTDDVGGEDFNLELSRRRAEAARQYLVSKHGVQSERLGAVGHGEKSPKVAATTKIARDENRRVELELKSRGTRSAPASAYRCGR